MLRRWVVAAICLALGVTTIGAMPPLVAHAEPCRWGSRLTDGEAPLDPLPPECEHQEDPGHWDPWGPMTPVTVKVNEAFIKVAPGETGPYEQNGRVFVPLRYVSEALGATVTWYQDAKAAVARLGSRYVTAWPDRSTLIANGWAFALVTKFGQSAVAGLVDGVIQTIASHLTICDRILCLDRGKLLLKATPAIWEQAYEHIDFANNILKAARDVGDQVRQSLHRKGRRNWGDHRRRSRGGRQLAALPAVIPSAVFCSRWLETDSVIQEEG